MLWRISILLWALTGACSALAQSAPSNDDAAPSHYGLGINTSSLHETPALAPPPAAPPPPQPTPTPVDAKPAPAAEWMPKMQWFGDIRYRLIQSKEAIDDKRSYEQLRVRLGMNADVNEKVKATIRLATGTSSINMNQTLGDQNDPGMPRRNFGIDWAYINWNPVRSLTAWAGRTANPYWSPGGSQLIFATDLAFEGLALRWDPAPGQSGAFVHLSGYMISENYASPTDTVDTALVGGDLGYVWHSHIGDLTGHFGNYHFLNIQNKPITVVDRTATTDVWSQPYYRYQGNTVYPNDPGLPIAQQVYYFQNKYVLVELGVEWRQRLGPVTLTLYDDEVKNQAVHKFNMGSERGMRAEWRWLMLSYAQIKKQADAVVGAFTDFEGNGGGTDNRGTRLQLGFSPAKNTSIIASQFKAKRGVDSVQRDYSATMVDVQVAF